MNNKTSDKLAKLASLRQKAEKSIEDTIPQSHKTLTDKKRFLLRTSITLRQEDQEAIQKFITFLAQNGFRQLSTSTVIQIALQVTNKNILKLEHDFIAIYQSVLKSDNRRK